MGGGHCAPTVLRPQERWCWGLAQGSSQVWRELRSSLGFLGEGSHPSSLTRQLAALRWLPAAGWRCYVEFPSGGAQ